MPSRNFDEERKHDPLVMISALFAGYPNLSNESRIKILECMYDSRHQAQERLWSGENLVTERINTAVHLWHQASLSYTEKTITITNTASYKTWRNEEEAIYTFHLPEGGVVSSLSLWIDGKECKGILTSKAKADSAYNTIVGYESRDPSVVHWQEGNTVTVRVFPVVAGESRMFKIGITAPLYKQKNKVTYKNIYFDGPNATSATEDIQLDFEQKQKNKISLPAAYSQQNIQSYHRSGKYDPDWEINLNAEEAPAGSFNFNGKTYSVTPYIKQREKATINSVYLDINKAWSKEEFYQIYELIKVYKFFVYDGELKPMNDANKEELFSHLNKQQFSLFPLFEIKDPATSLLISKSSALSPNISDLNDSRFMDNTKEYLQQNLQIRLFNLGEELSPYLKTLKEYRVFSYETGDAAQLKSLLTNKLFAKNIEDDHRVVIDDAGITIVQTDGETFSSAPDHLMRLFAYNHIMEKMGTRLLRDEPVNELVEEAQTAYVVSPVSSLVVLETQSDYDRFNIKDSKNSLKNASLNSQGAVPEPHEWALIIVALLALLYVKYKPVLNRKM